MTGSHTTPITTRAAMPGWMGAILTALFIGTAVIGTAGLHPLRAAEPAAPEEAGLRYSVEITGEPTSIVRALVKETSQLIALKKRLPATKAALIRRVRADEDRFNAILESEGFYAAKVTSTVEPEGEETKVRITIEPGERYTVAVVTLDYGDRADAVAGLRGYAEAPLAKLVGKPARAADVIAAEDGALLELRRSGFPFTRRGDRQLKIDHATHSVAVNLPVRVGRKAVFGKTNFTGQKRVKPSYLARLVPWDQGTTFDTGHMDKFRDHLVKSTLFSSVKVAPDTDEDAPEGAPLDVNVEVSESQTRTIGSTVKYSRDTGFGGSVFWQHRNLFGAAEKLDLSLDGDKLAQTAKAALTKPNFKRLDQTLKISTTFTRSTTEAFDGQSAVVMAGLERKISEHWIIGAAGSVEIARLIENGVARRSLLGGLPLTATRYVNEDDMETAVVDANKGYRITAAVTPYAGTYIGSVAFVRSEIEGDVYVPLNELRTTVIAARLKVGSIVGSATDHIPADRRFYGGGGGSTRGYGYQLIGPLDATGRPTGGRSLIEGGLETRFRITSNIGLVPFVDAGTVSDSSLPGKDASIRVAAGLGARYYTSVGPLRVDFAVPLNKRPGIDNSFQFYISFGQAF